MELIGVSGSGKGLQKEVTVKMSVLEMASIYAYLGTKKPHELYQELFEEWFEDEKVPVAILNFLKHGDSHMYDEFEDYLSEVGVKVLGV